MKIPCINVDLDGGPGWMRASAPDSYWASGRELVEGVNQLGRDASPLWGLVRKAASGLNGLLGGHFREEAVELAERIGCDVEDVLIANLSYDLGHVGCSTFVVPSADGPLHARNLDWSFPGTLLRDHVAIERVRNAPSGDYLLVTWPGLFSALTGVARGRFSVTVNYVLHGDESGLTGLVGRAVQGLWPSTWVVRTALNEKPNFAAAVRYLSEVPLLSPVLFTVAGVNDDERVVIERSCTGASVRRAKQTQPLFVTNHYVSDALAPSNVEPGPMNTRNRYGGLGVLLATKEPQTPTEALGILGSFPLLHPTDTQHQVTMCARTGELTVLVPGRRPQQFST
jgi:hypothetical protein